MLPFRRRVGSTHGPNDFELFVGKDGLLIETDENSNLFKYFKLNFGPHSVKLNDRTYYISLLEGENSFKKTDGDWTHYSPALKEAFLTEDE